MQNYKLTKPTKPQVQNVSNMLFISKKEISRMYKGIRQLGLAEWNPELEYPDFIHSLWNTIKQHHSIRSKKIEIALGKGDVIQLLSDVYMKGVQSESN